MMKSNDRRSAIAAYKEHKSTAGIYALRCSATGQVWVGQAPDVDTIQNRIWFTLRLGNNPHPGLQAAWRDHGAESIAFEILERMAEEESPYIRKALLKERMIAWRSALGAQAI